MKDSNDYLTKCPCGRTTSKAYAHEHDGRCKACVKRMIAGEVRDEELNHEHKPE